MKHFLLSILFLSFVSGYSQENCEYPDEYTPLNIADALSYLNCTWSDEFKDEFRKQDENDVITEFHFGIGRAIRNNWGFWSKKKNSLVKELESYGFSHPDDMSSAILSLFHRQLSNSYFDLGKELSKYKHINKKQKQKEKEFDNGIKQKYEELSVGDTIKVPFGVIRSENDISFSIYSNYTNWNYDDFDCIATGIIMKKTKNKSYSLTIKIIDIWFKDKDDYSKNRTKKIGDLFTHEMRYFEVITE